jgi:SAM-dependent methyltransferase
VSPVIDEHRTYLSDSSRLEAYQAAIEEAVRPDDVVLDLGCGTGILGLFACRAGARRVYALDNTGMIEVARRLAKDNGFSDRIVHIKQLSLRGELPERADVIVCDQMGPFGFEGGIVEYFVDARERFLKPGGKLIPARLSLVVAPVEVADLWGQVEFWNSSPEGFDFRSVRRWAVNTACAAKYDTSRFLADPAVGKTLDLHTSSSEPFDFEVCIRATRHGSLHGVAGWFSAGLTERVSMSNSPTARRPIDRKNAFFPVDQPVPVEVADLITIRMHIMPIDSMVTWKVSVARESGEDSVRPVQVASFQHSTFNGMLLSREQVEKTRPAFTPRLTRRGRARAFVLALCNGQRPLNDIEDAMFSEYHDLFGTRSQAAVFVGEVLANYAE